MTKCLTTTAKDWDTAPVRIEKISDLVLDWRLYPRKEVDHHEVVQNYAKALRAGCIFPTVKVGLFNGKKIIVDGVHRVRARKREHIDYAECSELPFDSDAELFAEAVRLNSTHGKNFTKAELQDNIKRLEKYKFDVKDIVAITHVPASEIYRESAAPVTVMMAPCGKKIRCNGQPNGRELVELKKALILCRDMARSKCIPDDEYFKGLVADCRLALKKVQL